MAAFGQSTEFKAENSSESQWVRETDVHGSLSVAVLTDGVESMPYTVQWGEATDSALAHPWISQNGKAIKKTGRLLNCLVF